MQITKTEYNEEVLKKWKASERTPEEISRELKEHLETYNEVFNNIQRAKNFGVYE